MKSFFQLREAALVEGEGIVTPRRKIVGEPEPGSYAYERKYGKYTAKGTLRKRPNPNKPPVKEENELEEAKGPTPGYMLKADPALAKKVKEKQDLHKVSVKAMGNPAAGKSIKEEVDDEGAMAKGQLMQMVSQASMLARMMDDNKQLDGWVQSKLTMAADYLDSVHDYLMHNKQDVDSMEESNGKKSAVYSTDVYGAKAYHSKCLEPGCDWESKRYDSMKLAQNAAQKHAQEHFKKGETESSLKEAHNPDRVTTHENPLVTVHNKHNGKWELHTHANLSAANKIFQTNVKHSDVHKGPVEVKSGGSYGNVKFAISKHHAAEMKKDKM